MAYQDSLLLESIKTFFREKAGHYAKSTIASYKKCLEEFYAWHRNKSLKDITQVDITDFIKRLQDRGFKTSTLNIYTNALKAFFDSCTPLGFNKNFKYKIFPKSEPAGLYISNQEYNRILDAVTLHEQTSEFEGISILALRNITILQVFIETGLTVSELCHLNLSDFDFVKRSLTVNEVERPNRILKLKTSTAILIKSYLELQLSKDFLFIRLDRAALGKSSNITTRSVERTIQLYSDEKYSPKDFRFTYIINHLKNAKGIYTLSDKVGGMSDDSKTFFRKKLKELNKPIEIHSSDYDAYEYLRHQYGKSNLIDLIKKSEIETKFNSELATKY